MTARPSTRFEDRAASFLALSPRLSDEASSEALRARLSSLGPGLERAGFRFACEAVGTRDELARALRQHRPRLALSSFFRFGPEGERASVHDLLERESIAYIGSQTGALELALRKSRMKRAWEKARIETPSFFCLRRTRTGAIAGLKLLKAARDYPYIVKPDGENENRGIHARSIAFDLDALVSSVEEALREYDELIVEHFVGGAESRECTVAMIGNGESALIMPAEIRLRDPRPIRVVTNEDRERNLTLALPIAEPERASRLAAFARKALAASGVRDYARCDVIEEGGSLFALEVNAQPRLPDPWFEACSSGAGLDGAQYVAAIALAALHRHGLRDPRRGEPPGALGALLPPAVLARLTG